MQSISSEGGVGGTVLLREGWEAQCYSGRGERRTITTQGTV